jgi:hypothetical protein
LDAARLAAFLSVVAFVYLAALRWCVRRFRRRQPGSRLLAHFQSTPIGVLLIGLAGAGLCCMAYGFLVEPTRLTVATYRIETPKIPAGESVRIVHLADLHTRGRGPREQRLPDLVRSLKPDLILHTGDFFARQDGTEPLISEILRSWTVPQYACEGNFDTMGDFEQAMKDGGVKVLNVSYATETIRGARLCIAGFRNGAENRIRNVLRQLPADTFNIVLYHRPCGFTKTWDTPADLMLAGHTHGGQVRLPFYGALITLDRFGKRWESGFFDENGVKLIVSRGLGCEPYVPEVRFLCPPEVVVIDLIGAGASESHRSGK